MRNVVKRFGGTLALDNVDLDVMPGEIHALLGQNGAGKSTLIKVLAGVHSVDQGEVTFSGQPLKHALEAGRIAFVHQELGLVNELTVGENMALVAGFARRGPLISWSGSSRRAATMLESAAVPLDPRHPVASLSAGDRAVVAIARALYRQSAKVLVLDEPTAQLHQADAERLFEVLSVWRARGVGVLYVTHRLDEVFRIADRVSVLRDGRRISTTAVAGTSSAELAEMIIGRVVSGGVRRRAPSVGSTVLELRDVVVGRVGPVTTQVREGECVALVGLRGAGQETVARALFGMTPVESGEIRVDEATYVARHPKDAIGKGMGFVPGNRADQGIVMEMTVRENLFLNSPKYRSFGWVAPRRERDQAWRALEEFDVRPRSPEAVVHTLSGGNQQKVVLARWLSQGRKVLLLEEPTAGVDVGAKEAIYALIEEFLSGGGAVVLVSADLDEVAGLADRALVFDRGRVVSVVEAKELTRQALVLAAAGAGASPGGGEGEVPSDGAGTSRGW